LRVLGFRKLESLGYPMAFFARYLV